MYKPNLALNNQQWLIFHKTQPNQTKQIDTPSPEAAVELWGFQRWFMLLFSILFLLHVILMV